MVMPNAGPALLWDQLREYIPTAPIDYTKKFASCCTDEFLEKVSSPEGVMLDQGGDMIQVQMGWNYDLENRVNGFAISFLGSNGFNAYQMTMEKINGRRKGKILSLELDCDFKLNLKPHIYFAPLGTIVNQLSSESSPMDEEFEPEDTLGIDKIKKVRDFFLSDSTVLLPLFLRGSSTPWDQSKCEKPDDYFSRVLWSLDR